MPKGGFDAIMPPLSRFNIIIMEWLKISTSTELVRVPTSEIAYVIADGNYSDLVLTNGVHHKMTFQLHYIEDAIKLLEDNFFVRVGRSLIVNKRLIYIINLNTQQIRLLQGTSTPLQASREALKELKSLLETEKR